MTTLINLRKTLAAPLVLGLALLAPAISAQTVGAALAPISAPAPPPASAPAGYPTWAYPWAPNFAVPTPDDVPRRLPGSAAAFSWVQARDLFFAPSWHPEDHPVMPEVVARGRKPDVRACGSCHRAEGTGGPENSSLAGLPVAYFVQQIADFKSGARKSSAPERSAIALMTTSAKAISDEEVQAAAVYFASLKPKRVVKVVESESAPKTYVARLFFVKSPQGGDEPLGQRIVETPDDVEQFELRDSRSLFTARVPPGSVARGAVLVKTGGEGATVACAACHGADLKGMGPIPGIAGRSPSYLMRQLFDFKNGARAGPGSAQMQATVANLSEDDMMALAAYVASLPP
jgi:cytochrome c553